MPEQSLHIAYTPRSADQAPSRDLVLLEQEPWDAHCGVLSRVNLLDYLASAIYQSDPAGRRYVDCGMGADGSLQIGLRVYPLSAGVAYRLATTIGGLSEVQEDEVFEQQSVSYTLGMEARLSHPAVAIDNVRWLTGPYAVGGGLASAPALTIDPVDRRIVRTSARVYGSALLATRVERGLAALTISADAAEAALVAGWSEIAVCLPAGGRPVGLELSAPPGAAGRVRSGSKCGRSWSGSVRPAEHGPPVAQPADKIIHCDYCTLECDEDE